MEAVLRRQVVLLNPLQSPFKPMDMYKGFLIFTLSAFALAIAGCITEERVSSYSQRHPDQFGRLAERYLNDHPLLSSSYCLDRYPPVVKQGKPVTIIDSGMVIRLADSLAAIAAANVDSSWISYLDMFVPSDSMSAVIERLNRSKRKSIDSAVVAGILRCSSVVQTVVHDTTYDVKLVKFWMAKYDSVHISSASKDTTITRLNATVDRQTKRFRTALVWAIFLGLIIAFQISLLVAKVLRPSININSPKQ